MRDSYHVEPTSDDMLADETPAVDDRPRNAIRPRRTVIERAQQRALPHSFATSCESRLVAPKVNFEAPHWEDLNLERTGENRALSAAMPVADSHRDSSTVRAFDLLRTRLRQTTLEHGWRNVAITAPTSGCGNTFTAVNLALSLSRVPGSRTVLMDFNLRAPGLAQAFDIAPRTAMRDYLSGSVPMTHHLLRISDTLALGLNGAADDSAAEALQDPATERTLERMRAALRPELVLYDMPAMLAHDDVSAFLPQLDGVLLVSDGTQTMSHQLIECERMLEGQVPLLGVVLNRARADSIPAYQ